MALPQRKDDPRNEGRREQPLGDVREVDREVGGGSWNRLWIWIVIAVAIIAVIWICWGFGGTGGWWWGNHNRAPVAQLVNKGPAVNNPLPVGAGVAVLNAPNKQAYIGKPFDVHNTVVQGVVNGHALWIGENNANPMLVVVSGDDANVARGDVINVTGTVQQAPSAQQAKSQWSLNDDDANRLEREGAYIQATQVANSQF